MRTGIHGYVDMHGRENLDQPLLVSWSADNGVNWSEPQRIHVGDRVIAGIYPRALLTKQNVLAVLRCRPDGSVIFSPNGEGGFWSNEHIHYRPGNGPRHAGMQDMALIGPNTILVVDVVLRGAGVSKVYRSPSRRSSRGDDTSFTLRLPVREVDDGTLPLACFPANDKSAWCRSLIAQCAMRGWRHSPKGDALFPLFCGREHTRLLVDRLQVGIKNP